MLVLTRKSRESVVVGGADGFHRLLKVTVLAIAGIGIVLYVAELTVLGRVVDFLGEIGMPSILAKAFADEPLVFQFSHQIRHFSSDRLDVWRTQVDLDGSEEKRIERRFWQL